MTNDVTPTRTDLTVSYIAGTVLMRSPVTSTPVIARTVVSPASRGTSAKIRVKPTATALIVPVNVESVSLDKFVMPLLGNVAEDVRQATVGPGVTKLAILRHTE